MTLENREGERFDPGTNGSQSYDVTFGSSGDFTAARHGLILAEGQADTVVDDPANDIKTASSTGVGVNFHGSMSWEARGTVERFRWVRAPTTAELTELTHAIAEWVGRFLQRKGLL